MIELEIETETLGTRVGVELVANTHLCEYKNKNKKGKFMKNKFEELLESSKYQPLSELDKNTLGAIMANTERETASMIAEGTISADIAQFTPFLMPMLRRVYPALIANELLGVQPMSGPTGFIYNLTNRFVGNQATPINPNVKAQIVDISTNQKSDPYAPDLVIAVGDTITGVTSGAVGTVVYVEPTLFTRQGEKPGKAQSPVGDKTFPDAFANRVLVELSTVDTFIQNGEALTFVGATGTSPLAQRTFSSEATWLGLLPQYSGSYTTANGEIRGTVGNEMNEVGIAVERKQIEARTRKLRAEYTIEMYQDLKAMHGVLADQELMAMMGYEIKAQTDREVVDFVNSNASVEATEFKINSGKAGDNGISPVQDGRWEIEKYRMFATKLSDMSRELGRLNRRGAGNKLLVSPKVITMLEQIGGFTASNVDTSVNTQIANGGVVGRFDNKFSVVVDNFATSEYATVIYKGSNQDSIGVYAPYTPVQIQKVTHVSTGQPALIAMSRYGLTTNPWQDSALEMGEKSPYASQIGVDFSNTVLA